MINEIKEILDYIDDRIISNEKWDKIKDYITNLQNEIFDLKDTIQNKNDCIGAYECIIEDRDKRIDKASIKAELIKDIGFDYDGYNDTENLKKVIDELVNLAETIQIILRGDE